MDQITTDQIMITVILGVSLLLFARSRWRHDLVAMFTLLAAVVVGVVPAESAFEGFGHPAVVTVAAVLIISQALNNAGVVSLVSNQLRRYTMTPLVLILALTSLVTIFSAFMNNVGALALMLPVTMVAANEYKISPAMLLMPLAFGSILGGLITLIGTPPNIIIASYRAEQFGEPFGMFEFAPVGVGAAIAGVLFISFIGWRLIPKERLKQNSAKQLFQIDNYLAELYIPETSPLCGKALNEVTDFADGRVEVVGVATRQTYARPIEALHVMQAQEILLVRCDPQEIRELLDKHKVELLNTATEVFHQPDIHDGIMLECVVSDTSPLVGRDVRFLRRRTSHSVALVGLARKGETVVKRLRRQTFNAGDVLLLFGHQDTLDNHFSDLRLWPLAERSLQLEQKRRPLEAMLVFMGAIGLGMTGITSLPVAFLVAIMVYVLMGSIKVREIYEQIDWPVIVLLGAMLPVGAALEKTGATKMIVDGMMGAVGDAGPVVILALLLILAMAISAVINNAATALVMAPISVAIAQSLDANPDTFLMAVAIGSSCAFLTPIGHQSNTLVMGPGGYRFGDYWRVGLPLEILIVVVSIPLLLIFWPL